MCEISFILTKKSNIAKCFFDICNADMALVSKIMKFGHSKSISYVKKVRNFLFFSLKDINIGHIQFLNNFIFQNEVQFLVTLSYLNIMDIKKTFCNVWFFFFLSEACVNYGTLNATTLIWLIRVWKTKIWIWTCQFKLGVQNANVCHFEGARVSGVSTSEVFEKHQHTKWITSI